MNNSNGAIDIVAKAQKEQSTAHSVAGTDAFPLEAMQVEENGKRCNVCHYPQPLEYPDILKKNSETLQWWLASVRFSILSV